MEQQTKAPAEIQKVAQFLRGGSSGLKNRVGALNGKRLDYFKGTVFSKKTLEISSLFSYLFQPRRQICNQILAISRIRKTKRRSKSHF